MPEKTNIHAQLVAFIADIPGMERSGNNPHFGSKYITFDEIMGKLRPLFKKHGIAIIHRVENEVLDGGLIELSVTPLAVNGAGETVEGGTMKNVVPNQVQQLGSVTTYLKRYSIAAFLGIAADVDDDGEANREAMEKAGMTPDENKRAVERYQRRPAPSKNASGKAAEPSAPAKATAAQAQEVKRLVKALNINEEAFRAVEQATIGKTDKLDKLTKEECDAFIAGLQAALDEKTAEPEAQVPEPEPEPDAGDEQ